MAQNILAFAATTHSKSINKALVSHAADIYATEIADDAKVEILDLNDFDMPIYSIDLEMAEGIPAKARELFEKIGSADALLISFAEHNGLYTAAFKNMFDWMSRIEMKAYQDKPMVIMATSPGPGGASNVLSVTENGAPFFGANIHGKLSVPTFGENFDMEAGKLTNADLAADLRTQLTALKAAV